MDLQTSPNSDFCPIDLKDWMDVTAAAGVPAIPARIVATVPVDAITRFDEPGDHQADVEAFYKAIEEEVDGKIGVLRWSCCAGADLKHHMAKGDARWNPEFMGLPIDDFRSYDLVSEFPRPTVAAFYRPWIALKTRPMPAPPAREGRHTDGRPRSYPLEARVFVEDGEVKGVSAYYPQLQVAADDADMLELTCVAIRKTRRIIDTLKAWAKPMVMPRMPTVHGTTRLWFTADFAMAEDGRVLFLEGGPPSIPGYWGADPCCFGEDPIAGVRLNAKMPLGDAEI